MFVVKESEMSKKKKKKTFASIRDLTIADSTNKCKFGEKLAT